MRKRILAVLAALLMSALPAVQVQAAWQSDSNGWRWQKEYGSYPAGTWEWLDGNNDGIAECYYFNQNGYMLAEATAPDGYQVNQDGAWVVNGAIQTKRVATVNYVNGVPYYTYPKEEETETSAEESGENYDEVNQEEIALKIVELVNKERKKAGKAELSIHDELMLNANVRAEECGEKFSHIRPDGTMYYTAITVACSAYSENAFSGGYVKRWTSDEYASNAMEGWMLSPGHKKNIFKDFDEIGVGVYLRDDGNLYIVQMFIKN